MFHELIEEHDELHKSCDRNCMSCKYNDWDAKSWAMQLHDIDAEILEILDSIDILESLIEELFTEVSE